MSIPIILLNNKNSKQATKSTVTDHAPYLKEYQSTENFVMFARSMKYKTTT